MYTARATKKLQDRARPKPSADVPTSTNALGDWYATVLFWQPQVALFVNESTLLPVLVPLAPARDVVLRFPTFLCDVLAALGVAAEFISAEASEMREVTVAKTANRSVLGVMNEFADLGRRYRDGSDDVLDTSLRLAQVPCGPLFSSHVSPEEELRAFVATVRPAICTDRD
jgi:hypothetical protein